jgi:branched-chain amino acid transport system permease protein
MMVALDQFVRRTKFGRGIRAVAQDPESAALMGVNSTRVVQVTFLIGGLMAGRRGHPLHDEDRLAPARMPASSSASRRSRPPSWVASATSAVRSWVAWSSASWRTGARQSSAREWKDVVAFVLLVLILLVRPSGLLGESLGKARA